MLTADPHDAYAPATEVRGSEKERCRGRDQGDASRRVGGVGRGGGQAVPGEVRSFGEWCRGRVGTVLTG